MYHFSTTILSFCFIYWCKDFARCLVTDLPNARLYLLLVKFQPSVDQVLSGANAIFRFRSRSRERGRTSDRHRGGGKGAYRPGNTVFVAGFNFITTEKDLDRKFSKYGRVVDVRIVKDRRCVSPINLVFL